MSTDAGPKIPVAPISFETLFWRPEQPELFSRSEIQRQTGDYQAAIPSSIKNWSCELPADIAGLIEDASQQISALDKQAQVVLGIDNPSLGPMSAILLRTESASSSQIEQITSSAKQLALAELSEPSRPNAETVIGNVRAMQAALSLSDSISEDSILKMHRSLMIHQKGFDESQAGKFRDQQVWIGKGNAGPRLADFVAPSASQIKPAIEDLIRFFVREDLPVMVQVAVGHAQFETIHPFVDGNGRTGRALVQSVMKNKGLISSTALPISAGLLIDVESYFEALGQFRQGNAAPIITQFAQASLFAAASGKTLIENIAAELEISKQKLSGVRKDAAAWKVLPALVGQPVVNSKYLTENLGLGEMAALRALDVLTEREVIQELTGWRRSRIWQHNGILKVLDNYGAKIRRSQAGG
jgi:Fic family protein